MRALHMLYMAVNWLVVGVLHPCNIEGHDRMGTVTVTVHTHGDFMLSSGGNQATGIMTHYPIQSHYPDTEVASPINPKCQERK